MAHATAGSSKAATAVTLATGKKTVERLGSQLNDLRNWRPRQRVSRDTANRYRLSACNFRPLVNRVSERVNRTPDKLGTCINSQLFAGVDDLASRPNAICFLIRPKKGAIVSNADDPAHNSLTVFVNADQATIPD